MQKLVVDNFGPIKHAEIELRDFVVLIGEQASGKSTLAKLVYFFKSLNKAFLGNAEIKQELNEEIIQKQFNNIIQKRFVEFYGRTKNGFKIVYHFDAETPLFLTITSENAILKIKWSAKADQVLGTLIATASKELNATSIAMGYPNPYSDQVVIKNVEAWGHLVDNYPNKQHTHTLYFPSERVLETSFPNYFTSVFQSYSSHDPQRFNEIGIVIMKEYLEYVSVLLDVLQKYGGIDEMLEYLKSSNLNKDYSVYEILNLKIAKILKAKYQISGGREFLMIDSSDHKVEVTMREASTGQQEVIRMLLDALLILRDGKNPYRVVEEPEAHLFPTAQKQLLELFSLIVNETQSQMFITTHSPYVLSVLSNLLYAKKVCDLGAATADEIEKATEMNRQTWLDKEQFAAYTMDNGEAKSIFDRDNTGLIDQNYLDQVSEDLGREFQVLHNLRLAQIRKEKQV